MEGKNNTIKVYKKVNLKRCWTERWSLQEQQIKTKQRKEELEKLLDEKVKDNYDLKKHNEQLQTTIEKLQHKNSELQSNAKADKTKLRTLEKNNEKKRKLLESEAMKFAWKFTWNYDLKVDNEPVNE